MVSSKQTGDIGVFGWNEPPEGPLRKLGGKTQLICIGANLWAASDKEEQDCSFTEQVTHAILAPCFLIGMKAVYSCSQISVTVGAPYGPAHVFVSSELIAPTFLAKSAC